MDNKSRNKDLHNKMEIELKFLLEKLKENPHNTTLYGSLADIYFCMENYEKACSYARMDIEAGIQIIGSHASRSYRIIVSVLQIQQADFSHQEKILQKAIAVFPRLPDLYAEYALLFFRWGQYDKAECFFKQALQLAENYHGDEESIFLQQVTHTYLALGRIYEQKNDYNQAIEYYQKILEINKYDTTAFNPLYHLICSEDPVYCAAYLNSLYDKGNKEDLEFLIVNISNLQRGKVLAYYMQAHNKLLKEKKVDILSLESIGNYKNVQAAAVEKLQLDLPIVTGTAILLDDFTQVEPFLSYIPYTYKNILLRFYQKNADPFVLNDFTAYQNVFLYLLQANNETILLKYSPYVLDFDWRKILTIAGLLKDHGYFSFGAQLYQQILLLPYIENKKDIVYDLAYCCYKIQNYKLANQYFLQARTLGCDNKDLDTLILWSKQNLLSLVK